MLQQKMKPDSQIISANGQSDRLDVCLPDGTIMHCRDVGSGPAIVLVHGWAADRRHLQPLQDELSDRFRVIAPDLRIHGETDRGTASLTIDTLADDLHQLLEQEGLKDVVVLGWSMGSLVLWRLIEHYGRDRLAGMIVEDMSPRILNGEGWYLGMSNGLDGAASARAVDAMTRDWAAYASAFAPRMFARDRAASDQDLVGSIVDQLTRRDAEAMAQLWISMTEQDFRSALPSMNLPVLVAYGEQSQAYSPETSRYLVDHLPDASRLGFARSGHAPHLEEPEEFARAVAVFASRVTERSNHHTKLEGS